jgi:hypothetical protein
MKKAASKPGRLFYYRSHFMGWADSTIKLTNGTKN